MSILSKNGFDTNRTLLAMHEVCRKRKNRGERLTGPRYLIHWCWSFDRGHWSRLTSLPFPTSSLRFHCSILLIQVFGSQFTALYINIILKILTVLLSYIHLTALLHSKKFPLCRVFTVHTRGVQDLVIQAIYKWSHHVWKMPQDIPDWKILPI